MSEVRITEEGVIPVFRVPGPCTPIPGGDGIATIATTDPVRAMVRSVSQWAERSTMRTTIL